MSLIHLHVITLSHCFIVHCHHQTHVAHLLCLETRSSKTSEVGANPESCLPPSIHQLSFSMFPLSYSHRLWGGLWASTASCIHLMNKRVLCNLQCQMHSLKSCLHLPSEKWSLPAFQREANIRGWIVYAFHIYSFTNCTTCNLVSYMNSHVFLSYSLFARQYIVFDVCIFKTKKI